MKRRSAILLSFSLLMLLQACSSSAKVTAPPGNALEQLVQNIDLVLQDSVMQQTRAGIKVISLQSGKTLYSRNSRQLFHPASNMKLLTTAAALKHLGTGFTFKTVLFADSGSVAEKQINGDIYLKGHGNPDLLVSDLEWMVEQLKRQHITEISGNLICDDRYLDDLYWGSGWMWDDVSSWYWAPITALSVNDNCVNLFVEPGDSLGAPVKAVLEPQTAFMTVTNNGRTVSHDDSLARDAYKVQRKWRPVAENIIEIEGGLSRDARPRTFTIDVVDGALYTGTLFREALERAGIRFSGTVQYGETPQNARQLVLHESPGIADAIFNTNKISDNLSAELLLKTMGAETKGVPGTAEKGISAIRRFLANAGVDSSSYELADGSGVSRYNVITPDLLIELLRDMHSDFKVQAEFKASLPIAGVDGSLGRRMRNTPAQGNLRAKTGSLRGVSSLSGYTTTADGELLAFSMIMEHFVSPTSAIRYVQDRIGALLSGYRK